MPRRSMCCATLVIQQRVLSDGDPGTLATAITLAALLSNTGQHAEAEAVLGRQRDTSEG